jgi:hypothetical protein
MIPPEVMAECRAKAQATMSRDRPRTWVAATVIVCIWVALAALAVALLARLATG